VAGSPRIEFVLEAIQAALAIVAPHPASQESERLVREAASLRQTVEGWRRSPPTRAIRDETMKRVLRLHVGAATLARLSPPPLGQRTSATHMSPSRPEVLDEHDRPTAPPPFDIEAFARQTSALDSERRIRSEPPTQPFHGKTDAQRPSREPAATDQEVDRALAPLTETPDLPSEPITARRPSLSVDTSIATPAPRTFSPSSIERAILGAVDGPLVWQRDIDDPAAEMLRCYELGDYTGAIALADLILAEASGSLVALECRTKSGAALEGIYAARLGPLSRLPIVVMAPTQIDSLDIDHRAGFLLSLVDGSSTIEGILDVCGMPRLDALRILHELVQRGAVGFG
jgi:hypothetical protein